MTKIATVDDIPAIRRMAAIAFRDTYRNILSAGQTEYMMDMMYSERSLTRQMTEEKQNFIISDGVGYVSIRPDGALPDGRPLFHLEKLYLLPERRGGGEGRRMFNEAVALARELAGGPVRIELNVNRCNPAVSFYEHMGMRRDRSGDFPIGGGYYMNDYIMVLDV